MTKVIVHSGACGFVVTIQAEKTEGGKITIRIDTDCDMVKKMIDDIAVLDRFEALTAFQRNPVYRSAAKHLKHVACTVPSGIIKAIEVEAGLNVAKNADICFAKT
jgi:hypothetical protein